MQPGVKWKDAVHMQNYRYSSSNANLFSCSHCLQPIVASSTRSLGVSAPSEGFRLTFRFFTIPALHQTQDAHLRAARLQRPDAGAQWRRAQPAGLLALPGRLLGPRPGGRLDLLRVSELQGAPVPAGEGRIQATRRVGRPSAIRGFHQACRGVKPCHFLSTTFLHYPAWNSLSCK